VIVAETKDVARRDELAAAIRTRVAQDTGLTVDEVAVVEAGTIPKTSSGKLQRRKARQQYEEGGLSKRVDEGKLKLAGHLVESQLAHLELSIFGKK